MLLASRLAGKKTFERPELYDPFGSCRRLLLLLAVVEAGPECALVCFGGCDTLWHRADFLAQPRLAGENTQGSSNLHVCAPV